MHKTNSNPEKLILISASASDTTPEPQLTELAQLAQTAGAEVLGEVLQKRDNPQPAHYLGKGKLDELKTYIEALGATGILCDDELTPTQLTNLDSYLQVKILDRTMLILDIFANHAVTAEGQAQVEMAQLKYRMSRLKGLGITLSRQGGSTGASGQGIGAKGPGEKKLETDRRHAKGRIGQLSAELQKIREERAVQREKRLQSSIPIISLVGYTNAGKSTLMNALTDAGVLVEDKLFATLDTTTRKTALPGGAKALFTDTVGFIHKLPHHLIQAFRATLEELQYATILLHVVDISDPEHMEKMAVVRETLRELNCLDKPMLTVFNKADRLTEAASSGELFISAKTGAGLPELFAAIETALQAQHKKMSLLIPYSEGHMVNLIHEGCEVLSETHTGDGTVVVAYVPGRLVGVVGRFAKVSDAVGG